MPEISVIIPAKDAAQTIGKTLAALATQQVDRDYEVIVVDDSSQDGTSAVVQSARIEVRLLSQARQGPAAARNLGASVAEGRYFAFTDADCVPRPDWLSKGIACLEAADLVQGAVVPDPSVGLGPFDRTVSVGGSHGLYETANILTTRALFEGLGGFEDWLPARIGKPLAEDVWFGWRARRDGARVAFCGDAVVEHAVFPRGSIAYAAERLRLVYFPAMAAQIPELRDEFFYRRVFLNRRSASFDLAIAGLALGLVGVAAGSAAAGLVAGGALILPYLRELIARSLAWRRRAPLVMATDLLADAIGAAALVVGSIRNRSPVL